MMKYLGIGTMCVLLAACGQAHDNSEEAARAAWEEQQREEEATHYFQASDYTAPSDNPVSAASATAPTMNDQP